MQGDLKLVNINDERFWDILFDEACVEGQQATRIRNELEKIIAYSVEDVIEKLEDRTDFAKNFFTTSKVIHINTVKKYIRNGGKE